MHWNAKVANQKIPGITGKLALEYKVNQAKAKIFSRERTAYSKHPLPTTQERTLDMDITRCSIPKSD